MIIVNNTFDSKETENTIFKQEVLKTNRNYCFKDTLNSLFDKTISQINW